MIQGVISNQFLGCPLQFPFLISFTDTVTGAVIQFNTNLLGEYTLFPGQFNYSDNPILIQIFLPNGPVAYQEVFVFPPGENGAQRVWRNLNFIITDPDAVDCQPVPRPPNPLLCSFYAITHTCENTICVYNTQSTNWSTVTYDFGNGFTSNQASLCYTYESYGNFIITQTLQLIVNGVVVDQCQAQLQININNGVLLVFGSRSRLPRASFSLEENNCCVEDCNDFRLFCVNVGDCVKITPEFFINDQDCCVEVVAENEGEDTPPVFAIQCEEVDPICNRALQLNNYQVLFQPGNPLFPANGAPEYVLVQKNNLYNIGLSPFTFQFDLGFIPPIFPVWVQPLGNYPPNSPRVLWSWQNSNKPCDNLNTPKIEIGCYYTFDDRIQFTIRQTCPVVNEMSIFSVPNVWAMFAPGPFKVTIVKGNNLNSNDWTNYFIYVNGVNVKDLNVFVNNLPVGFDNINLIDGPIAFGVEWNGQSLTNVNAMAPLALPQNLGQGISHNYGNLFISSFRFYNRILNPQEILEYANANCSTNTVDRKNLLLDLSFDFNSGNIAQDYVLNNNGLLYNYQPVRLQPFNDPDNLQSAWLFYCCNTVSSKLIIRNPDNSVDILSWEEGGFVCFPEEGLYKITLEVCNCCGCCEYSREIFVGPRLYIQRINCLSFKLIDNFEYLPNNYRLELKVYNTEGVEVLNQGYGVSLVNGEIIGTGYLGNTEFEIILPQDGMYVLEYKLLELDANTPPRILTLKKFILIDFCKILECYSKLIQTINCTNCNDCLNDIRLNNINMQKLNLLLFNFQAFIYNIITHYGSTEGTFIYDDEYLTFVKEGQYYIEQLLRLCGACNYIGQEKTPIKCIPKKREPCCGK